MTWWNRAGSSARATMVVCAALLRAATAVAAAETAAPTAPTPAAREPVFMIIMDDTLRPTSLEHNALSLPAESRWLGFFSGSNGDQLREVTVRRREAPPHARYDMQRWITAAVDGPEKPLFLVRGGGLQPGLIRTRFVGKAPLVPGLVLNWPETDPRASSALVVEGVTTFESEPPQPGHAVGNAWLRAEPVRVLLVWGGLRQVVTETNFLIAVTGYALTNRPRLVFAGDLDRDGRTDLILEDSGHWASEGYSLYLSTAAGPGELVRHAAGFTIYND